MTSTRGKVMGVILAAGKGTRMYPFSETLPKPILPVCNEPLLATQLAFLRGYGVTDVIIVIGHLGYAIVDALGDGTDHGVSIRYVEQNETLGMAHAIGKLEKYVDSPFVLLLGDIYFATDDLAPMIDAVVSGEINGCLASKLEPDPDMIKRNFAIIESEPGVVKRVIEKPRYVRSSIKGCGLYIFDQNVFDAIRRTPRTAMRDEYEITDSIQIMIDDGHDVRHSPVVHTDMNLTFPEDLLRVNMMELRHRGLDRLVGDGVSMDPEMVIERSVVGDDVEFAHPFRLRNSVVFSGAKVRQSSDQDLVIIHGGNTIHCEGSVDA